MSGYRLATAPEFVGEDVLLNYGANISFNEFRPGNRWNFNYSNLLSEIVVTPAYVLVAQEGGCATLIKINLTTMASSVMLMDDSSPC